MAYISKIKTNKQELEIGGKNFNGSWTMKTYAVCSNYTLAGSGQVVYDISSYLPNDGYDYEIYLMATGNCPASAGKTASVYLYSGASTSDYDFTLGAIGAALSRHSVMQEFAQSGVLPVKSNRKKIVIYNGHANDASGVYVYLKGYRRIGKNGTKTNYISKINTKDGNIAIGGNNFDGSWVKKNLAICTSTSIANGGSASYNISSYLPNDNDTYEVMVCGWGETGTTSNKSVRFKITSDTDNYIAGVRATNGATMPCGGSCIIFLKGSTNTITINNSGSQTGTFTCYFRGYRKVGANNDSKQYLASVNANNSLIEFGGNNFDGQWVRKSFSYEWTSLTNATSYQVSLSSYLPNDGYAYEIQAYGWIQTSTTSGQGAELYVGTDLAYNIMLCRVRTRASSTGFTAGGTKIYTGGNSRTINVWSSFGHNTGQGKLWLYGYRRLGTNT